MVLIFWSRHRPPAQPTWPESQSRGFSPRHSVREHASEPRVGLLTGGLSPGPGLCPRVLLPLAPASPNLRLSQSSELRQVTCQSHQKAWVG